jgi:hypothetical protein
VVVNNVIAFSLWGSKPLYWVGALRNIELAKRFYPAWVCRVYVDDEAPVELKSTLISSGAEVIFMRRKDLYDGMFWRFLAASDPTVDIMLSRDCDSRIGEREAAAVAEWLASEKDFHVMRDHPHHRVPILGGMWGCRNRLVFDMDPLIGRWTSFGYKGCDQDFLRTAVYPRVIDKALEHSEFGHSFGGVPRPFPTERRGYSFVGEVFDANDVRDDGWRSVQDHLDKELPPSAIVVAPD